MFSSDDTGAAQTVETTSDPGTSQAGNVTTDTTNPSKTGKKLFGKRPQTQDTLPHGTGPGTSGRPAPESELDRSKGGQMTSDAAAAMGGTQTGIHQGTGDGRVRAMNGDLATSGGQATYAKAGHTEGNRR
jgi:hypothetical protein